MPMLRRGMKLNIMWGKSHMFEARFRHLWGLSPLICSQNTLEEFVSLRTASVFEKVGEGCLRKPFFEYQQIRDN